MNKLIVKEDIKNISTGEYELLLKKNTQLIIDGDVRLENSSNKDLVIDIKDNSSLKLDTFNLLNESRNIEINIFDNSIFEENLVIINKGINRFIITINMLGNNSTAKIKLRVINTSSDDKIDIECNGKVESNTLNNILIEDLKGLIINNETIKISPNIKVLTNEVEANHLVTIGAFDKEELFYLKSKGLSDNICKKLLIESFVTGIISEKNKEKIKMEVSKIE